MAFHPVRTASAPYPAAISATDSRFFQDTDNPSSVSWPYDAAELGLRFSPKADGDVTGISFYKIIYNYGPHTGSIYDSNGNRLASLSFTNETRSGWQHAAFASPVHLTANSTYIVAYNAPYGRYSLSKGGLSIGRTSGPLTTNGTAGVRRTWTKGVASVANTNDNYWVDVHFRPTPTPTPTGSPSTTSNPSPTTSTPTSSPSTTSNPSPTTSTPTATPTGLVSSGQIIAKSGDVITGKRISTTSGSCVIIPSGVTNVTISSSDIGPCGSTVNDVGVLIQSNAGNINIARNKIHDVASGVYASGAQNPIAFVSNTVTNVRGPMPRGQMIQFDKVSGGTGQSRIVGNVSDRLSATITTHYEDHINIFSSSGSAAAPILISCNRVRGGDSGSGSAVVVGDYGGQYIDVRNNVVVDVPNTGIGVAGGSNITIAGNLVDNAGDSAASQTQSALYVMTTSGNAPNAVTITGNRARARAWMTASGDGWGGYWSDGTATNLVTSNNVWGDQTLSPSIFDNPIPGCA